MKLLSYPIRSTWAYLSSNKILLVCLSYNKIAMCLSKQQIYSNQSSLIGRIQVIFFDKGVSRIRVEKWVRMNVERLRGEAFTFNMDKNIYMNKIF